MTNAADKFLLVAIFVLVTAATVGVGLWGRWRLRKKRILRLSGRANIGVDALVTSLIEYYLVDRDAVTEELHGISRALSVPVGLLRPDDVLQDLIGTDYFVGDAVLEIERRLQLAGVKNSDPLTLQMVVLELAGNRRAGIN